MLFTGDDICLIFCEPRQQDVVDLLCSLSALSSDAPVDLAAMALSRLQPSQQLPSNPSSPPTWHIEQKYGIHVPVPVSFLFEEDVKPGAIPTGVPVPKTLNLCEETGSHDDTTSIKLDVENILFGPTRDRSDLGGDEFSAVLDQDKFTRVKNGRKKIRKKQGASQWGRKKTAPSGRKNAGVRKIISGTKSFKTGLDSSSCIKAEAVEEDNTDNNNLDNSEPAAQRFANMKVPVPALIFQFFALADEV
jgi:hypothetical protein